jgi:hypothetical protein
MNAYKIPLIALIGTVLLVSNVGAQETDKPLENYFAKDVGPLCVAALLSYGVETGKKCYPDRDMDKQKELEETQLLLDQFILNDPNWNEARLVSFKRRQGGTKLDKEELCKGDALHIGSGFTNADPNDVKASIQDVIDRYDKPIWGTCL